MDSPPDIRWESSTSALTTVFLAAVQAEAAGDPLTPFGLMPAEECAGMILGLVALTAVRHPEWFMAHAQRIVAEQFADDGVIKMEAVVLLENIIRIAPVVPE